MALEITDAIEGGANPKEIFKSELKNIAEEKMGASEMLNEEVDENGNNVQSYKSESGEEFKIIDYAKDEGNNLNQAEALFLKMNHQSN